ncbi:hypothetical protein SO802_000958 [Lithocarpus litseifolius]|uniref:RNase H type-1 domain-containing protein n=1 Tax=Lithocarpus litseifolius TaxID=425828 RepID=A0AAW2DUT1_9ROSI
MVEALACRRAVQFAKELSIFYATFKGDAEIVTNALHAGVSNHPEFGLVINDSLVLASDFRICNFANVKRLDATFHVEFSQSATSLRNIRFCTSAILLQIVTFNC